MKNGKRESRRAVWMCTWVALLWLPLGAVHAQNIQGNAGLYSVMLTKPGVRSGHSPMDTEPEKFLQAVFSFIDHNQ